MRLQFFLLIICKNCSLNISYDGHSQRKCISSSIEAKVAKRDVRDAHSLAQKLIGKDRTLLIGFQVYKSENNKAS